MVAGVVGTIMTGVIGTTMAGVTGTITTKTTMIAARAAGMVINTTTTAQTTAGTSTTTGPTTTNGDNTTMALTTVPISTTMVLPTHPTSLALSHKILHRTISKTPTPVLTTMQDTATASPRALYSHLARPHNHSSPSILNTLLVPVPTPQASSMVVQVASLAAAPAAVQVATGSAHLSAT